MLSQSKHFSALSKAVTARLQRHGVKLTLGGEPSYVPVQPEGPEWNVTALGPSKLEAAWTFTRALLQQSLPTATPLLSPGKTYPGEVNPRWAIHLLRASDGSAITRTPIKLPEDTHPRRTDLTQLRRELTAGLKVAPSWIRAEDTLDPDGIVWVLPLDYERQWMSGKWRPISGAPLQLVPVEGPAGLRLPLADLPAAALRRALVLEMRDQQLHIFLPPLLQNPFVKLLQICARALRKVGIEGCYLDGYVPEDNPRGWEKMSVTPDPGVLEINLPACASAVQYAQWLTLLDKAATASGLCSFKSTPQGETLGTGGGNHLLFGGPTLEENAFFRRPRWLASILRYWQHHPALSYLFTGSYVGPSSQAPRPDECSRELYDLEMAYQFLEELPDGEDHRGLISETLRHLHIDRSGNTHRSEISFDKFWNVSWEGGCRGLIEFRAIETLPRAEWSAAVALLWAALAAYLLENPIKGPLLDHGPRLHDYYFLATPLWNDLQEIFRDLAAAGFHFEEEIFRAIWEYRFDKMLEHSAPEGAFVIRRALEGWPLLCETPLLGGSTSRFVDTSIERLEFSAPSAFAKAWRIFVQGRELVLSPFPGGAAGAGLRYRRTALFPSLHPGVTPQIPLYVSLSERRKKAAPARAWRLDSDRHTFRECPAAEQPLLNHPCQRLRQELLTYDLRLL